MQNFLEFTGLFLEQIPDFLLSEPICYVVALMLLGSVVDLINDLIK